MNVVCTLCQKPLMIRDEFAGKPMRCPHCQGTFQAPALSAAPAAPAGGPVAPEFAFTPKTGEGLGDLPVTHDHGNAVDFDWTGAEVSAGQKLAMSTGDRGGGVVHDAPVVHIGLGPGWQLVNFGLRLQSYAVMVFFGVSAWMTFASLVVSVGAGGKLIGMSILLSYVVGFSGIIMGLAGLWMCTQVPEESQLRPLSYASAGALSVAGVVLMIAVLSAPRSSTNLVEAIASGIGLFGTLVLAGGALCLVLFLRNGALFFGEKFLAKSLLRFVVFALCVPIALRFVTLSVNWFVAPELTKAIEAKAVVQMLHFLVALIFFVWFFNLLRDLRRIIATGLQRHAVANVTMPTA